MRQKHVKKKTSRNSNSKTEIGERNLFPIVDDTKGPRTRFPDR